MDVRALFLAASVGIASLYGCSKRVSVRTQETVTQAGKLYFHVSSSYLTNVDVDQVITRTVVNYRLVGIDFQEVKRVEKGKFPQLERSDILFLLFDDDSLRYSDKMGKFPACDLGVMEDSCPHYVGIQEKFELPYEPAFLQANIGYVDVDDVRDFVCEQEPTYCRNNEPRKDAALEYLVQVLTHEIGHALGSAHVATGKKRGACTKEDLPYFMQDPIIGKKRFHPENVTAMHTFIVKLQERQSYENPFSRSLLRWNYHLRQREAEEALQVASPRKR